MPGLDYIKGYEEGGDVDQTPTQPTAIGKAVQTKTKYGLPTPTGAAGVDEGILQKMQEMIKQREAQKGSFMESLRDAQAWWSGGMAGPSEALNRRAKEREEQEATTFGMRRDLAQYRVAQEQARAFDKALFGATPQPTAATQPGAAGAAPAATVGQPQVATAAPQTGGLIDLVKDPGLRQSIIVQAQSGDRTGALKETQKYLAANAKDPDIIRTANYLVNQGFIDRSMLPQIVLAQMIGPSFKPEDVRTTVGGVPGTYQTTPFEQVSKILKQPQPGAAPAAPPPAAAPAAPTAAVPAAPAPAAPTAAAPPAAKPTGAAAGPQPIAQVQPLPKVGQAPEAPVAPAGQAPKPAAAPVIAPVSKESLAVTQATETKRGEKRAEASEKEREDFKASVSSSDVVDRKVISDRIAELVQKNPKIAGVISDPTFFNGLAQLVKSGISTPKGPIGLDSIEDFIFKSLPSTSFPDEVERKELASYLARFELMNSQLVKGQGQVSNAERQIIRDASVSISDPAEAIYKRAKMVARRAELDSQLSDIYGGKEYTNFEDFKRDPAYKAAFKQYENDLREIVKEKVVLSKENIKANRIKQPKATPVPKDVQDILKKYPGKP